MVTVPMMFLFGVFFPLGAMPGWLQPLISLMPLTYAVKALRGPMPDGAGMAETWPQLAVLGDICAVFLAFAVRFFMWDATAK